MTTTWIILGGTSTIARSFARKAAERGDGIILAGRDMEDMETTASDCRHRGAPFAEAIAFDARSPDTFTPIMSRSEKLDGSVSVAVFVGSMPSQEEIDADPSLIDGVIRDSFTGPAEFLTAIAPTLEARAGGTVVGVGSVAGDRGRIGNYVYGASKAGLINLTQTMALELAERGIRVNSVSPGPVITEAFREVLGVEDKLQEIAASIPLGRAGLPEDIANMVLFLCSPAAAWITGEHHLVAGGRTHRSVQYKTKPS